MATAPAPKSTKVTQEWPGAFGVFKESKRAVLVNLWPLVGIYLLGMAVSIFTGAITGTGSPKGDPTAGQQAIGSALDLIVGSAFGIALVDVLLSSTVGRKLTFSEGFRKVSNLFIPFVLLYLLTIVIAFGSLIALIIPFFFIMPRIMFAPYFLVDRDMSSPVDALRMSWEATRGNLAKIYGIAGATLVMILPALTIIGIPVAIYLVVAYSAAPALLYRHLISKLPA